MKSQKRQKNPSRSVILVAWQGKGRFVSPREFVQSAKCDLCILGWSLSSSNLVTQLTELSGTWLSRSITLATPEVEAGGWRIQAL